VTLSEFENFLLCERILTNVTTCKRIWMQYMNGVRCDNLREKNEPTLQGVLSRPKYFGRQRDINDIQL
jgi:hypothetical protein